MLPLHEQWFRRLLLVSIGLGVATGLLGLGYLGATGAIVDGLFDRGGAGQRTTRSATTTP